MLVSHHFSTQDQPRPQRLAYFQRAMAERFSMGLAVSPLQQHATSDLCASVRGFDTDRIGAAALRLSPHRTEASGWRHSDRLLLSLLKEGTTIISQDGREGRVRAGEMFLIDPSRPFAAESNDILAHSLYIPKVSVRALLPEVDSYTARTLRSDRGVGAALRLLVDELIDGNQQLDEDSLALVADAVPGLIAATLRSQGRFEASLPGQCRLTHRHRVRRFVQTHLADPNLCPEMIAAGVQLSTRYIYELFADEPHPLMKMIWFDRLERCRCELADRTFDSRSVSEIALHWGFSDMGHFSRSFKQRFGRAPRDYRRHHKELAVFG